MSNEDSILKEYFQDPRIFADTFNFFLAETGLQVDPGMLRPLDTDQVLLPFGIDTETRLERFRDLLHALVSMTDGERTYLILGIENQAKVHLAMPVRNMLYDAMQYSSQIQAAARAYEAERQAAKQEKRDPAAKLQPGTEFLSGMKKGDRLIPVISLVIYYSPDPWDGPRTLHGMLNWEDGRDRFRSFVPDYALNLIEPAGILPEEFSRLTTPLKQVLEYIKYSNSYEDLLHIVDQDEEFRKLNRQTVRLLNQVAGAHISYTEQEESMDMNKALKDMIAIAVKEKDSVIQQKEDQLQVKDSLLLEKDGQLQKKDSELRDLQEQNLQRARKMISDGLTVPQIIDYTGLTEQEIQRLMVSGNLTVR